LQPSISVDFFPLDGGRARRAAQHGVAVHSTPPDAVDADLRTTHDPYGVPPDAIVQLPRLRHRLMPMQALLDYARAKVDKHLRCF
jgi:hypothetical protein